MVTSTANGYNGQENDPIRPQANFNVAELMLENATADTLLILDCCSASNIMKGGGEQSRSYELMAATGKDMPTGSGDNSYTKALIKALGDLRKLEQPFTTYELNQMIIQLRDWNTSSHLYNRLPNTRARHIALAPPAKPMTAGLQRLGPPSGYLDIRISFENQESLTDNDVNKICKKLCKLPRSTGLSICDIEYRGFMAFKDSPLIKRLVRIFRMRLMIRKAVKRFRAKKRSRIQDTSQNTIDNEPAEHEVVAEGSATRPRRPKRRPEVGQAAPSPRTSKSRRSSARHPRIYPATNLDAKQPLTPSVSSRGATPNT